MFLHSMRLVRLLISIFSVPVKQRWCFPDSGGSTQAGLPGYDRGLSSSPRFPMPAYLLYQRDDCHLCDLALEILASARLPEFDSVYIDDDAGLEARYGLRVPVLRDARSDRELDWPFDRARVQAFVAG
jgi:hypothetical protein